MLIRVAVAVADKETAQRLTNQMISFSLRKMFHQEDIEFDFAYCASMAEVLKCCRNVDMSMIAYDILENNMDMLPQVFKENPAALSIPVGKPDERVCNFLALRPAGHIRGPEEQEQIDRLCLWCAEEMMGSTEVLQLKTRQGCYAITTASILFCQSDQKYVMVTTETGEVFRKLDKLDHLAMQLPEYFLRVHQSFLINSRRISGVDKTTWEILLDSGNRIPVSRAHQKNVAEQLQKCLYRCQK